jgi:hypothetical protein
MTGSPGCSAASESSGPTAAPSNHDECIGPGPERSLVGGTWVRLRGPADPAHSVATDSEREPVHRSDPAARGAGVGESLLGVLLAETRAAYCAVVLTVRAQSPAVRLYESGDSCTWAT